MIMANELIRTLTKLDNAFGVSGDETDVASVMREEMEGLYDEYMQDAMGSQYFIKYGKKRDKKILFSAHMDEIGFIINYIEDEGFLRFLPVGYHDDRMAVNQDMIIKTAHSGFVKGVTGSKPAHIMTEEDHEKVQKIEELFVDIGTDYRAETEALGIRVGDYMTFDRQGYFLNNGRYYTGKSVDDRSGCAVLVELARRLKEVETENTIIMVGSVQEEVGLRSGGPIMANIDPDVMIAVDVTITGDVPGIDERQCSQFMGRGPSVKFYDWDPILGATGNNVPHKLTDAIISLAEKNAIPYQREVFTGGGTDAWSAAFAGKGYLAGGISIPQRYMHTGVGTVHMGDLENVVRLVKAFAEQYKIEER